jgi:hypothetical protein
VASLLGVDITHIESMATDDRGWTLSGYIHAAADDRRMALMAHIHGWPLKHKSSPQPSSATRSGPHANESRSAPAGNGAPDEALAIVRKVADTDAEIVWTREPRNERERELRAAIIKRIETENHDSPWNCWNALDALTNGDDDRAGYETAPDLRDALERRDKRCNEAESEQRKKSTNACSTPLAAT